MKVENTSQSTKELKITKFSPSSPSTPEPLLGLNQLPDDLKHFLCEKMPLDAVCRLGQTSQAWRRCSRERAELDCGRVLPLLADRAQGALARLMVDPHLSRRIRWDDVDAFGMTALMHAASAGWTQLVKHLLTDCGANAQVRDKCEMSAKAWADIQGHDDVAYTLGFIDDSPKILLPSLWSAAQTGHVPLVMALVARGGDINLSDSSGRPLIHNLARYAQDPQKAIASAALAGANLHVRCPISGVTLAHIIARYAPHPERGLSFLASRGVALDGVDHDGWTPQLLVKNHALRPDAALLLLQRAAETSRKN